MAVWLRVMKIRVRGVRGAVTVFADLFSCVSGSSSSELCIFFSSIYICKCCNQMFLLDVGSRSKKKLDFAFFSLVVFVRPFGGAEMGHRRTPIRMYLLHAKFLPEQRSVHGYVTHYAVFSLITGSKFGAPSHRLVRTPKPRVCLRANMPFN